MLNASVNEMHEAADYLIELAAALRIAATYAPQLHPRARELRCQMGYAIELLKGMIEPPSLPIIEAAALLADSPAITEGYHARFES